MDIQAISLKEFQDGLLNYINLSLYPFPDVSNFLKNVELSRRHQKQYIVSLLASNYIKRGEFEEFNSFFKNENDDTFDGGSFHLSITDKGKDYLQELERKATEEIEKKAKEQDRQLDIKVKKSALRRDEYTIKTARAALIISILSLLVTIFKDKILEILKLTN